MNTSLLRIEKEEILKQYSIVDELYCVPTNEILLVEEFKKLIICFAKLKSDETRKLFEERIYHLYAGIKDDILSISAEEEIDELMSDLGLLSIKEYYNIKKLNRKLNK